MGISRTTIHKDKMKVFVIAAACLAGAAASPTPQFFDGVKDFFKGLAGDDAPGEVNGDYEQVPYKTINKTKLDGFSYEIREYPSVKWACTQMTYDMDKKENNEVENSGGLEMIKNVMKMMSSSAWKKRPSSMEFMKLFRYISGVNEERQEIEMTVPVLTQMTPSGDEMTSNMCFYLDSAAQSNPPTPEDPTVIIEDNKPFTVAVYEFGGYAMRDSVWMTEKEKFEKYLGDRANSVDTDSFYTASYDSPMKFWNRRNEIMFPLKEQ